MKYFWLIVIPLIIGFIMGYNYSIETPETSYTVDTLYV
jgi:hypothetical protein